MLFKKIVNGRTSHLLSVPLLAVSLLLSVLLSGCNGGPTVSTCGSCGPVSPQQPIATTLTLTAPSGPLVQGQSAQFEVTVSPAPTGSSETFEIDDTTGNTTKLGTGTLHNGTATVTVNLPFPGIRTYSTTYAGDGTYETSSASAQLTVTIPVSTSSCGLGSSIYVLSSGSATPNQTNFASNAADQSAVCAQNDGTSLTLTSPVITKSGTDTFLFAGSTTAYGGDPSGIDAGVLAYGNSATTPSGATINLEGTPSITASSANYAAFASGSGAALNISDATVSSKASGATLGAGNNGQINVTNSQVTSDGVLLTILNGGTAVLQNSVLTSSADAAIVFAGPVSGANAASSFEMSGGVIALVPPLFKFTGNQAVNITLSDVDISKSAITYSNSFDIVPSTAEATLQLTLDNQKLQGIIAGSAKSTLTLKNGSILDGDFLGGGSVTLDASSSWTIHSSFGVQAFNDPDGIKGATVLNITGNGQTITYSSALNQNLGGLTYSLQGGGFLKPD